MAKRRKFTPEFKAEVVLEVLGSATSQAEMCRHHNLNENQLSQWKRQLLENASTLSNAFSDSFQGAIELPKKTPKHGFTSLEKALYSSTISEFPTNQQCPLCNLDGQTLSQRCERLHCLPLLDTLIMLYFSACVKCIFDITPLASVTHHLSQYHIEYSFHHPVRITNDLGVEVGGIPLYEGEIFRNLSEPLVEFVVIDIPDENSEENVDVNE